ncbi:hypothetical protein ACHHYP_05797 [Achlya hypogyna]|uniref:Uncharacterized protein n=1 Tax=Achlya hypogyna TaxID=1202772 RepID=A0A1V9YWP7_ACHHY|nr:hypothetical protein ACHHYP_05797 [Achlya hypogyna]
MSRTGAGLDEAAAVPYPDASAFTLDAAAEASLHEGDAEHSFAEEMAFRLDRYMQSPDKDDDEDAFPPLPDDGLPPDDTVVSLKDQKRQRIQTHPMVASVSSNGREVECKCGRLVRLNPPWYILKYEQHLVSRNCGNLKAPRKRKIDAASGVHALDAILAMGEPGPDTPVLVERRYRVAQQLRAHPKFVQISPDGLVIECRCTRLVALHAPWHLGPFLAHVDSDVCGRHVQRKRKLPAPTPAPIPPTALTLPCPGLRSSDATEYVKAAVQLTGGARPRHIVARELFPRLFPPSGPCEIARVLCDYEKKLLHDTLQREALWWIDKDANTVRSLQCTGAASRGTEASRLPCAKCAHLKSVASLRTALASAAKPGKARQAKFIPKSLGVASAVDALLPAAATNRHYEAYVRELKDLLALHAESPPNAHHFWLVAAEFGVKRELDDHPVLIAVLDWLLHLKEKERRGVGKQNMPAAPALDAFLHAVADLSEDAANLFQQHFCGRTKKLKTKQPPKTLLAMLPPTEPPLPDLLLLGPSTDDSRPCHVGSDLADACGTSDPAGDVAAGLLLQREAAWAAYARQHPHEEIPCPGITNVREYVDGCFQLLGGSRPRHVLAKDYLPDALVDGKLVLARLTPTQTEYLGDVAFRESLWRIDKAGGCVRSRSCARTVARGKGACAACLGLHRNATFRSAVSRARKKCGDTAAVLENLRFTPRQFTQRDPLLRAVAGSPSLRSLVVEAPHLADERSVFWLKVARLGLGGAFRDFGVVEGVVQSVLDLKDKARRGVGKQNMSYTPALDAFLHDLAALSLPAFELFAQHFCVRSLRSSKLVKKRRAPPEQEPMAMPAILMYSDDATHDDDRLLSLNDSLLRGVHGADLPSLDSEMPGSGIITL